MFAGSPLIFPWKKKHVWWFCWANQFKNSMFSGSWIHPIYIPCLLDQWLCVWWHQLPFSGAPGYLSGLRGSRGWPGLPRLLPGARAAHAGRPGNHRWKHLENSSWASHAGKNEPVLVIFPSNPLIQLIEKDDGHLNCIHILRPSAPKNLERTLKYIW